MMWKEPIFSVCDFSAKKFGHHHPRRNSAFAKRIIRTCRVSIFEPSWYCFYLLMSSQNSSRDLADIRFSMGMKKCHFVPRSTILSRAKGVPYLLGQQTCLPDVTWLMASFRWTLFLFILPSFDDHKEHMLGHFLSTFLCESHTCGLQPAGFRRAAAA